MNRSASTENRSLTTWSRLCPLDGPRSRNPARLQLRLASGSSRQSRSREDGRERHRKSMRAALPIVCVSIGVFVWPTATSARCAALPFKVQAVHSPVVVRGRPVATRREVVAGELAVFMVTTFTVERVWKGQVPSTVHLYQ